jgi:hypothetical protein
MFESLSPEIASAMTVIYQSFFVMEGLALLITVILTVHTRLKVWEESKNLRPNEFNVLHFKNPIRIIQMSLILLFFLGTESEIRNAVINSGFNFTTLILTLVPLNAMLVGLPWFLLIHGLNVQVVITDKKIIIFKPWRLSKSIYWKDIIKVSYSPYFLGIYNIHTELGITRVNEKLFWSLLSTPSKGFYGYIRLYAPQADSGPNLIPPRM